MGVKTAFRLQKPIKKRQATKLEIQLVDLTSTHTQYFILNMQERVNAILF